MSKEITKNEIQEQDEIKSMNLYEKMSRISQEIGVIAKNLEVKMSATRGYKAISERDVLDAVRPVEAKYRVFSYPSITNIENDTPILEQFDSNGNKKVNVWMRLERLYTFVNIDNPEEKIEIYTYGDGIDTNDKAPGKAMTYADKYALLKAYKISTGDDLDTEPSQPVSNIKASKTPSQPVKQESKQEPVAVKSDITEETIKKLNELKIDLKKVAVYFGKNIAELTEEDCQVCIDKKKNDFYSFFF